MNCFQPGFDCRSNSYANQGYDDRSSSRLDVAFEVKNLLPSAEDEPAIGHWNGN
jgi:hypothetical protein